MIDRETAAHSCEEAVSERVGLVEADGKVVSELAPARQGREPLRCSNQFLPVRSVLWPLSPQSYKNVSVTTAFLRSPKSAIFFFRSDPLWMYVEYTYWCFRMFLSSILVFQKTEVQTLYRGYSYSKRITNYSILAWYEVLTAVLLKNQAFWDVRLYRLVDSYRRFGAWCLYVQGQAVEGGGTLLLRNVKYLPVDGV